MLDKNGNKKEYEKIDWENLPETRTYDEFLSENWTDMELKGCDRAVKPCLH